jgi:hypothetical protein
MSPTYAPFLSLRPERIPTVAALDDKNGTGKMSATTGLSLFPDQTIEILRSIAADHGDDGYRFNAIQILMDLDALDARHSRMLLLVEIDADVVSLLEGHLATIEDEAGDDASRRHP